jgi:hypothetical protein
MSTDYPDSVGHPSQYFATVGRDRYCLHFGHDSTEAWFVSDAPSRRGKSELESITVYVVDPDKFRKTMEDIVYAFTKDMGGHDVTFSDSWGEDLSSDEEHDEDHDTSCCDHFGRCEACCAVGDCYPQDDLTPCMYCDHQKTVADGPAPKKARL